MRIIHQFALDTVNDEIVVPNAFAEAILFFSRDASGEEAPIRVIQGPKTKIGYIDNVEVDPIHDEVFTAVPRKNAILVFRRDVGGNVAPIRIIHGPKTKLSYPWRVMVDVKNDLLVVLNARAPKGILIFRRTDEGNVAPQAFISGPNTGMKSAYKDAGPGGMALYPEGKKIFVAVTGDLRRDGPSPGFVGVWKYTDDGDVAPWAVIKGPATKMKTPFGQIALNPEAKEIMVMEIEEQALLVYRIPELFEKEAGTKQ